MKTGILLAFAAGLLPQIAAAHSAAEIYHNPFHPRAEMAVTTQNGRFAVVVAPNLVDLAEATAAARAETAQFCQSIGKTAPATFRYHSLHSTYVLDAWEFGGKCD